MKALHEAAEARHRQAKALQAAKDAEAGSAVEDAYVKEAVNWRTIAERLEARDNEEAQ